VARLTATGASTVARRAAPGWMRWAHSSRDGLVHAFPIGDSQLDRWVQAVCAFTVSPAALGPATVVGPRCPRCVLAIAAACPVPRRGDRPGVCARLLACRRRERHDPQLTPLVQVLAIGLPPTTTTATATAQPAEHEFRAPGVGPGAAALVARNLGATR
jgi:hypothetical protein